VKQDLILNNGFSIPRIGLGTWQAHHSQCREAVSFALNHGYRHIDGARIYENEAEVGSGIKDSGVKREEIFLTTKLWNDSHGPEKARKALENSLKLLGTDYVDLYLIHWPYPQKHWEQINQETWIELEKLVHQGKIKSIGLSNFVDQYLDNIMEVATIRPAVNQIKMAPGIYHQMHHYVKQSQEHNIEVESYSPLDRGVSLNDSIIGSIARKYGKSPSQVVIRWHLQHGFIPLPKSVDKERIVENFDVWDFTLEESDIQRIDELNNPDSSLPNPDLVEI